MWISVTIERPSYAESLRAKLEHAHVESTPLARDTHKTADQKDAVEPDLVAAMTNMGKHAKIHPIVATLGECLPPGYARSSTGFLICTTALEVKVDQDNVRKEIERLQRHAVIAYFVGGRQSSVILNQWTVAMQAEIGEWVGIRRDLGQGFFQVLTRHSTATQKLLMRTPHRLRWGTCILQTWATGFNASHPTRLKVPTWVTLRGIPGEFLGVAKDIAGGLGELLGSDKRNAFKAVALQSGMG